MRIPHHVLGKAGVVAGGACHVLGGCNVWRNPVHTVHVVGGFLPVDAELGLPNQLVHFLGSAEVLGNEFEVAWIPRQFRLAVAHHGAPAHLWLVVSRFVCCTTSVGVVLDLAAVVVVRFDRIAGHVVWVKESFLVRLNHHLLNFFAGCTLLNALAGTTLCRLDEPHAHLITQERTHRFFPTNLNSPACGHVPGVLKALHLGAGEAQDLLIVRNKSTASPKRLFVTRQQHPTMLVQAALGIRHLPQPKLVLYRVKRSLVVDQPATV